MLTVRDDGQPQVVPAPFVPRLDATALTKCGCANTAKAMRCVTDSNTLLTPTIPRTRTP